MNSEDPIGIIELGNIKIKCLIFKINNNKAEILSTSTTSSDGIHNDVVMNLTKATNAIFKAHKAPHSFNQKICESIN